MISQNGDLCSNSGIAYNSLTTLRALNNIYFRPFSHDQTFIELPLLEKGVCAIGLTRRNKMHILVKNKGILELFLLFI